MLDILDYSFFQNALTGVILLSIISGMIGTYIVSRRMVAISGGITHTCFGGLGLGYFLGINPLLMAGVTAVAASVGVEWMSARRNVREDTAIAVVWALGMALGVLFVFLTPGYVPELNAFLFGNILTINPGDLTVTAIYVALLALFYIARFRYIVICAFDRDFARVAGVPVKFITMTMTVMVAIGIVLSIRMVGIMLLISMVSLPQIIAEQYCHRFSTIMWASTVISLVSCLAGLMLSTVVNVPCSAMIVITLVVIYLVSLATVQCNKKRHKSV